MPIDSPHPRINGLKLAGEHRDRGVDVIAIEALIEPSNELSLAFTDHLRTPPLDYQDRRDLTTEPGTLTRDTSSPAYR